MNKLITAVALAIALPGVAHAQAARGEAEDGMLREDEREVRVLRQDGGQAHRRHFGTFAGSARRP